MLTVIFGAGISTAIVSGLVQLILWKLNRKAIKEDKKSDGNKNIIAALNILLYDRIKYLSRKHIGEGHIALEELEDLIAMHKVYHDDLKGNGFLDNIMLAVKKLPIIK